MRRRRQPATLEDLEALAADAGVTVWRFLAGRIPRMDARLSPMSGDPDRARATQESNRRLQIAAERADWERAQREQHRQELDAIIDQVADRWRRGDPVTPDRPVARPVLDITPPPAPRHYSASGWPMNY